MLLVVVVWCDDEAAAGAVEYQSTVPHTWTLACAGGRFQNLERAGASRLSVMSPNSRPLHGIAYCTMLVHVYVLEYAIIVLHHCLSTSLSCEWHTIAKTSEKRIFGPADNFIIYKTITLLLI